jgi:hypothetical protein
VDFPTNPLIQDPTEFLHHDAPQLLFSARVWSVENPSGSRKFRTTRQWKNVMIFLPYFYDEGLKMWDFPWQNLSPVEENDYWTPNWGWVHTFKTPNLGGMNRIDIHELPVILTSNRRGTGFWPIAICVTIYIDRSKGCPVGSNNVEYPTDLIWILHEIWMDLWSRGSLQNNLS